MYDEYAGNYPAAMKTLFDLLTQSHVTSRIQAEQGDHFLKALQVSSALSVEIHNIPDTLK